MSLLSCGISDAYGKMSLYCSLLQRRRPNCIWWGFFLFAVLFVCFLVWVCLVFFESSLFTQHLKKLSIYVATSDFVEIGKKVDKILGMGK